MDESKQRSRGVGADIIVRPPGSSLTGGNSAAMPQAMVEKLGEQPHVTQSIGVVQVLTSKLFNMVTGVDYAAFKKMSGGFTFVEGDDAHAFANPHDIVIDTDYAAEAKLHAGSQTNILGTNWHISAVVETGKLSRMFVQGIRRPPRHAKRLNGKVSAIYLKLDDPEIR